MKKINPKVKAFIILDIFILLCFLVVYGPIDKARVFWITTAMETGTHKYFANIFYSNNTIYNVLKNNSYEENNEISNPDEITVGIFKSPEEYTSIYEKEILEHNEDEEYKYISFKYNEFDCHLIVIYDPTRVVSAYNTPITRGNVLSDIVKNNDAILGINGGGYFWSNNKPRGLVVSNGEVIYAQSGSFSTAAFTYEGKMIVGSFSESDVKKYNIKEALSFFPILINNGQEISMKGNGGSGLNPRTVIAQRRDGIVLMLVVNGYGSRLSWKGRGGVYYKDLLTILKRYGAYNAVNMDGGSSATMVIGNKLINDPCEPQYKGQDFIRSAWIFK